MATAQLGRFLRHVHELLERQGLANLSDGQLLRRFVQTKEEAAFTHLVRRHGPMVLSVARRAVGNASDAEDVFQETFLVLARKAGRVRKKESVASWLFAVAHRLAVNARIRAARRRFHESRVPAMPTAFPAPTPAGEFAALLDEELRRLPDRSRAVLVLCYLEGQSREEAARNLGWTAVAVKAQLQRARERLRRRLAARGVALSGGLLAILLTESTARAAVPAGLIRTTVAAALQTAVHPTAAGLVLARIAGLATTRTLIGLGTVLALALAGLGWGLLSTPSPSSAEARPPTGTAPADRPVKRTNPPRLTRKDEPMLTALALTSALLTPAQAAAAGGGRAVAPRAIAAAPQPPRLLELKPDKDGKIRVTVFRPQKLPALNNPNIPGGRPGGAGMMFRGPVRVELAEVKDLTVTTVGGKKVTKEDALKALAKGGAVVVSADGKAVPATFLKMFKPDVLVLAAPELAMGGNGIVVQFGQGWAVPANRANPAPNPNPKAPAPAPRKN